MSNTQNQDESHFNASDSPQGDHEYFASTVTDISLGRDKVTSLRAEPSHVFDIVWNLDLNYALNTSGVTVPYIEDAEEQVHEVSTVGDNTHVYLLSTDTHVVKINCIKSVPSSGSGISIAFNLVEAVGDTEANAMLALQKLLRYDGVNVLSHPISDDVGSTLAVSIITKVSTGIINSLSTQQDRLLGFLSQVKKKAGSLPWYASDSSNEQSVPTQVKFGLAQLFDREPELNNLMGSAATSSAFLDTDRIAALMDTDGNQLHDNLFSVAQLTEVLEAVSDRGSRTSKGDDVGARNYVFLPGDSITAVVKVTDTDSDNNSDRWLVTLQQI
jgi:hypothetical protein